MAIGQLWFSGVRAWADLHGLDYEATVFLKRVLRVVEVEMRPASPAKE